MIEPGALALIRAALKFWEEEMGTHDFEQFSQYFSKTDRKLDFQNVDIGLLRQFLETAKLAAILQDSVNGLLKIQSVKKEPKNSGTQSHPATACIASVLVSPIHAPKLGL